MANEGREMRGGADWAPLLREMNRRLDLARAQVRELQIELARTRANATPADQQSGMGDPVDDPGNGYFRDIQGATRREEAHPEGAGYSGSTLVEDYHVVGPAREAPLKIDAGYLYWRGQAQKTICGRIRELRAVDETDGADEAGWVAVGNIIGFPFGAGYDCGIAIQGAVVTVFDGDRYRSGQRVHIAQTEITITASGQWVALEVDLSSTEPVATVVLWEDLEHMPEDHDGLVVRPLHKFGLNSGVAYWIEERLMASHYLGMGG